MAETSAVADYLCGNLSRITQLHAIAWLMLVLNTAPVFLVSMSQSTEIVVALNYAGILPTLLVTGGIIVGCRHR